MEKESTTFSPPPTIPEDDNVRVTLALVTYLLHFRKSPVLER